MIVCWLLFFFFFVVVPPEKFLKVTSKKIKSNTDFVCMKNKANSEKRAEEINV